MARRQARSDGLRELLIVCREHRLPGCPKPGPWVGRGRDELLEALKAGGPVEVGSADLMLALMHGGQDYRRFAFGGADAERMFRLDGDRLLPGAG
jgi:hypothetical protein